MPDYTPRRSSGSQVERSQTDYGDLNVPLVLFCELRGRKNHAGPTDARL